MILAVCGTLRLLLQAHPSGLLTGGRIIMVVEEE